MPTGSCLCGNDEVSYTSEPAYTRKSIVARLKACSWQLMKALCYCDECRKLSCLRCLHIPKFNFKIEAGELKTFTKVSDFSDFSLNAH